MHPSAAPHEHANTPMSEPASSLDLLPLVVLVPLALVLLNAMKNIAQIFSFHSGEEVTAAWTSYGRAATGKATKATTW